MVKDKRYYENKLNIIIYLLNSSDDEEVTEYLLDEYNQTYKEYEKRFVYDVIPIEGEKENIINTDWI